MIPRIHLSDLSGRMYFHSEEALYSESNDIFITRNFVDSN